MQAFEIEFVVEFDDGVWKLYRDGELVCPYTSRELAESAAKEFVDQITKFGGTAVVRKGEL